MGIQRKTGYSATVEGFFVFNSNRIRLAKTSGTRIVLSEPCELAPGASGDLVVIVDGESESRRIVLPKGIALGEQAAEYVVEAPF